MSLYEASTGLLETHVTWDELQNYFQSKFSTNASFGPSKKAVDIADMKGFGSKIALIDADWQNIETDNEGKLPNRFVVKIGSQLGLIRMMEVLNLKEEDGWTKQKIASLVDVCYKLHNHEILAYELIEKYGNDLLPYTKVYGAKKFSNENQLVAYIITEFKDKLYHVPMHESVSYEDMIPVVKAAAAFSALGVKATEDEKKIIAETNVIRLILGDFFNEKALRGVFENMRLAFSSEYHPKIDELAGIYSKYYAREEFIEKFARINEYLHHDQVLVHCDLWSSNILFSKTDDSHLKLEAIIDYQTMTMGSPGQDIARLLSACLTTSDRRAHKSELVRLYYETFNKCLDVDCKPYTYKQLEDSYDLLFPIMTLLVIPGIASIMQQTHLPADQKEEFEKAAMDKMIGLLEDTLNTHHDNLKKYPDFFI